MVQETAMTVRVKVQFGQSVRSIFASGQQDLSVSLTPSCTIREVKERIATAAGGKITANDLLLTFGPNDRKIGRQFHGDPAIDESQLKLEQYSVLSWLRRFPNWSLSVCLLPAAPLPPGVAIHRAAATAEGKDPERAVQDARAKGEIPKIADLPAPWGPKPLEPQPQEALKTAGYLPPKYPASSSPMVDASA